MDFKAEILKAYSEIAQGLCKLLWHTLHFMVTIWYFILTKAAALESYLICNGFPRSYSNLNLGQLRNLAIVVDSEEANNTSKIYELIQWLVAMGIKNVCLYDSEGVLKKSKGAILEKVNKISFQGNEDSSQPLDEKQMNLEFASFSDGKEAIAKAANFLYTKSFGGDHDEQIFTEPEMTEALHFVGSGGPDPELLLVYGPARCHLGFPTWRIRYTEIVHMGPLKSMRYGSLIKAIYKFTMVRQNYGK